MSDLLLMMAEPPNRIKIGIVEGKNLAFAPSTRYFMDKEKMDQYSLEQVTYEIIDKFPTIKRGGNTINLYHYDADFNQFFPLRTDSDLFDFLKEVGHDEVIPRLYMVEENLWLDQYNYSVKVSLNDLEDFEGQLEEASKRVSLNDILDDGKPQDYNHPPLQKNSR